MGRRELLRQVQARQRRAQALQVDLARARAAAHARLARVNPRLLFAGAAATGFVLGRYAELPHPMSRLSLLRLMSSLPTPAGPAGAV